MDPRSEIVLIDRELDQLLVLPEAEAVRRIFAAYQTSKRPDSFVLALIGRLIASNAEKDRALGK